MPQSFSSRLTEEIRRLIDHQYPFGRCDACLALHFGVTLAKAKAVALKLAGEPGLQREHAICEMCHRTVELTSMVLQVRH